MDIARSANLAKPFRYISVIIRYISVIIRYISVIIRYISVIIRYISVVAEHGPNMGQTSAEHEIIMLPDDLLMNTRALFTNQAMDKMIRLYLVNTFEIVAGQTTEVVRGGHEMLKIGRLPHDPGDAADLYIMGHSKSYT